MKDTKPEKVEFIAYHYPGLEDDDYTIEVKQSVKGTSNQFWHNDFSQENSFPQTRIIRVKGPQFSLTPQDIEAVFPPADSLGDHFNVLPHVSFRRSTLPWERQGQVSSEQERLPWLAVLLFDESERPATKIIAVKDLTSPVESGGEQDDAVTTIGVPPATLGNILPTIADLPYLTHVRQPVVFTFDTFDRSVFDAVLDKELASPLREQLKDSGISLGDDSVLLEIESGHWVIRDQEHRQEYHIKQDDGLFKLYRPSDGRAVVVGNRLPKKGASSYAYLVSVEKRYGNDGFDFATLNENNCIELVVLKSWRFSCTDPEKNFKALLNGLNTETKNNGNTVRLPKNDKAEVETLFKTGRVPLPHLLRRSGRTVSWYRGPLIPGENPSPEVNLPARAVDELLRYDRDIGMFDVSYAGAWELGRLLMLQNKRVSTQLYTWKRTHIQKLRQADEQLGHLPICCAATNGAGSQAADDDDETFGLKSVKRFFDDLSVLNYVPFNYLLADKGILPKESIRFFQIDRSWVDCLIDGAISIGRVTGHDHETDMAHCAQHCFNRHGDKEMSGILLRSEVVSGWPGLLVDAYDNDSDTPLSLARMGRLSPNVLICLFEGVAASIDVHLKPEALHLGFDPPLNGIGVYEKKLRNIDGAKTGKTFHAGWKNKEARVIDTSKTIENIKQVDNSATIDNPAQFAFYMIEGVPKVSFKIKPTS